MQNNDDRLYSEILYQDKSVEGKDFPGKIKSPQYLNVL